MTSTETTAEYIRERYKNSLEFGIVLGTGLGSFTEFLQEKVTIPFENLPQFPTSSVKGHQGRLVLGEISGKSILVMQGRVHCYEGVPLQHIGYPIRVMAALGITQVIITNACGTLNDEMKQGEFMIITDHINFIGDNPLIGTEVEDSLPRFPDMRDAYDPGMAHIAEAAAGILPFQVHKGIYSAVCGPLYLSKAELEMVKFSGADVIGMSTIPETIVARQHGLCVLGLSCITDEAIPDQKTEPLTHEQVIESANKAAFHFCNWLKAIVEKLD